MLWTAVVPAGEREEAGGEGERRDRRLTQRSVSQSGWTGRLSPCRLIIWSPRLTCRGGLFLSLSKREFFLNLSIFIVIVDLRMKTFVIENEKTDHLLNSPPDKRINPWLDKVITRKYFKIWSLNVLKTLREMKSIGKRICIDFWTEILITLLLNYWHFWRILQGSCVLS